MIEYIGIMMRLFVRSIVVGGRVFDIAGGPPNMSSYMKNWKWLHPAMPKHLFFFKNSGYAYIEYINDVQWTRFKTYASVDRKLYVL